VRFARLRWAFANAMASSKVRSTPYGIVVISLRLRHCNWSPSSSKSAICLPHDQHSSFHTAMAISPAENKRAQSPRHVPWISGLGVLELGMTVLGIYAIRPLAATSLHHMSLPAGQLFTLGPAPLLLVVDASHGGGSPASYQEGQGMGARRE
jgi:hypothetical protein